MAMTREPEWVSIDPVRALNMVRSAPIIAFDTETTGLSVTDVVCGWVIADHERSIYVPVRHQGGNILDVDGFEHCLGVAFRDRARRGLLTVGHNLGFDLRISARHGVFPEFPLEDTMINEALIDDTTRGYGLEDCCERHRVTLKKGSELYAEMARRFGGAPDRKQMQHFSKMPGDLPVVVEYAAGDGISTIELRDAQQPLLDAEDLRRPWELECKLIHHVAKMHATGLRIDMGYGAELAGPSGLLETRINQALAIFPAGFNVNSPKGVEGLYRAEGFKDEDFARTPQKAVSFTERWLSQNEIGEAIIAVRQLKKAKSTFVTPLVDTLNVNGRIHPILNQSKSDEYGAIGARFSCSEPNLQAFPKRNETIGKLVRKLIIADEGKELVEGDAKQQEPRFFAWFSDDTTLRAGYLGTPPLDIHDMTAQGLKLPRKIAKTFCMGILNGMQPPSLARHMRWPVEQAEHYVNEFFGVFPGIRQFQKDAKGIFKHTGYVKSILGRKARLEDPKWAYRAVSRVIQNSGGEHIKLCLLHACEYAEAHQEIEMLLTIHDSLIWQRWLGFDDSELIRILENVAPELGIDIPIPFEVGVGQSWSIASYGE
jgi:DNA polymerase-1